MILFRRFVSGFGVALCAAPIFILSTVTVSAQQQGNYQADLLYELQAMRQEIAELRDMVERQDYQLRQLQRASQQTDVGLTNSPSISSPSGQSNTQPYLNSDLPSADQGRLPSSDNYPVADNYPSTTGTEQQTYPNDPQQPSNNYPVGSTGSGVESAGQYPAGQYPVEGTVEERVIGQQANNSGYPPVEERTIGDSQPAQVPVYEPPLAGNQTPATDGGNLPSDYPTPYERTEPSRQPIPNTIPSTAQQPGGVIAVPSTSDTPIGASQAPDNAPLQNSAAVNEQALYQQGFELLKQSQHDEAVATFKQQIGSFPSGEYADDAHYWIAESSYVNRELDQSKLYFRSIIDNFPQSPRVPDAMLKTAYIEQEQGNDIEARILLQEIIQYHPRSNAAISAKNRLADIQ